MGTEMSGAAEPTQGLLLLQGILFPNFHPILPWSLSPGPCQCSLDLLKAIFTHWKPSKAAQELPQRGLLSLEHLFWQFSTLNYCQKIPTTPSERCQHFTETAISVHANSNTPSRNTDPPNRVELVATTPGELKEFKNVQNLSLQQCEQGLKCHFCLHSLPTKPMSLHTQPLQRALSFSLESFFQQGQTGAFSSFATKLRLTWKRPCLGHLSILPGENILVLCHWDGTILDYTPSTGTQANT